MIRLLCALTLIAATAPDASAQRGCPADRQWDPNQGSCVPIKRAPRRTPEQKYQTALRHIDGTARRARPERGVSLLEQNCRARHAGSCTMLGFLHRHGRHVSAAADKSARFYEQGCTHGDAEGCLGAAAIVADGLTGKPDQKRATSLLDRACKLNSGKGCFELAEKHAKALGTREDKKRADALYVKARTLLQAGCANSGADCYYLGLIHARGLGTRRSDQQALAAYIKGCDAGSGDACREVGTAYRHGRGVAANQLKARQFLERGCMRYDNADSCKSLVWMMVGWSDSARDNDAVRRFAVRACKLDKRQCILRGYIHGVGIGVPKNPRLASRYYLEACESGSPESCHVSGVRSKKGLGVPASTNRAIALWTKACELSWGPACHALGESYSDGDGVKKNMPEAYRHFYLACIRRSGEACLVAGRMLEAGTHGKKANVKAAIAYYSYACDKLDHGSSCTELGDFYFAGKEVQTDPGRGGELYERACSLGTAGACRSLGQYRYSGQYGDTDKLAAARLFAEACRHGESQPCWWIDRALSEGGADDAAKKASLATLEDACKRDQVHGCQVLGRLYAYGGAMSPKRPSEAVKLFERRCSGGDSRGCFELGWLYAGGVGVVKNTERAAEIFAAECDKNTPGACYALGIQLWEKKDYKAAFALMKKACEEDDAAGCTFQAFAHYTAKGVRWNVRRAAELWKKACELDNAQACANVGELYWNGIAMKRDRAKAVEHYQKGCTPTDPSGCTFVGRSYHLGISVDRDLERAEREYKRMCNNEEWGSAEACVFLAELYGENKQADASAIAALRQQAFDMARDNADGNPYGHYVLGNLYAKGVAVMKNPTKALEHYHAACEGYDPLGCARAGELLLGKGSNQTDRDKAVYYLDRACAAGLADSCARATEAREPPEPPVRITPTPGPKKASSCAGCGAGGGAGGWIVALIALALAWRRPASG